MSSGFRNVIFFVALLAVAFIGYRYMIEPANESLSRQKSRVAQKQDKLSKLDIIRSQIKDLDGQVKELQSALDFFESKLPPSSEIYKVLRQVTLIAKEHGLTAKTITTLKTKEKNSYVEQPLRMELEGDFIAYYEFLTDLEKMDRITRISKFEINKIDNDQGDAAATFVMSIFFQGVSL
jgi:type IV pilus assembly protein PilO